MGGREGEGGRGRHHSQRRYPKGTGKVREAPMTEQAIHHKGDVCQHRIYRLSCRDFDDMYEYAAGCCQICKTPEAETVRGRLVIDHDPNYDRIAVRGLLCDRCNSLMSRSDRGQYEPLALPYRHRAWFVRKLRATRDR
jgi:hypothetical protein